MHKENYDSLDASKKRLANRLIKVLSTDSITDQQMSAISRAISRGAPSGPKKKTTGYLLFYKTEYPKLRKQHADFPLGDQAKLAGKQWAALSEEARAGWKKEAAAL